MRGFSLIELLVSIAIISILSAVAAPSFISFIKQDRLVTNANQLYSLFKMARSEAVKREQTVSLIAEQSQWEVQTQVDSSSTTLATYNPSHSSISVALEDIAISSTGYLSSNYDFLITDSDSSTSDIRLCILQSGQSWLDEEGQNC